MPQELCFPCGQKEINQHLFLGVSVTGFNAQVGWNEQVSQLSVDLVEDTCAGEKICYDSNLESGVFTDPDPGFIGEQIDIIGMPAYFRFGDFEFGGIISDWTRSDNQQGQTYQVNLVDPRRLLEQSYLITGKYGGFLTNTYDCVSKDACNVFNVYGFMEMLGVNCPPFSQTTQYFYQLDPGCGFSSDGPVFGSYGGFGGSCRNDRGMPLTKIIQGVNTLINSFPLWTSTEAQQFSPNLRILGCGNTFVGLDACGLIERDGVKVTSGGSFGYNNYLLDLSELPVFTDNYYRINEDCLTIMELINRVCEDAGFDYYIELVFAKNILFTPNGIGLIIKLRTVNRKVNPNLNGIQNYINSIGDCLVSRSIGQEFRDEPTTKVVIGGQKQTIYQICQDDDPEVIPSPEPGNGNTSAD